MNIKNIKLKHGVFLAPLAGVSDNAFRQICIEQGAEFCTTEMISAKAVNFKNKKTLDLAKLEEFELPSAVQLFGSEPESMYSAAKFILENCKSLSDNFANKFAIDINMGCPVPKIIGGGDGSALMREPILAEKIISAVVKACEENNNIAVPVTIKIRAGWNNDEINAVEIAKIAEDSGVSAVFIHGRTREQMYSPPVNLEIIKQVKQAVKKIPVVGNGDIFNFKDAQNMLDYTKCDGIMIGRGSFGNPFIFREIIAGLNNEEYILIDNKEKFNIIKKHLDKLIYYKGEKTALLEARKHLSWYIKGNENSAKARDLINKSCNYNQMLDIVWGIFDLE